ncbi:hypothetical protein ACXZ1K_02210 [Pedobacter sp. PWIIR3]
MKKLAIILGLICLVFLLRCAAFKKTSSVKTQESISADKQTEWQQLKLKTAVKETNVVTFNRDGTVYQQAYIKEQVDQAKLAKLKVEERLSAKSDQVEKLSRPESFWMVVIAALLIVALLFYLLKLRR